jgi:hypothetical protein
MKPPLYFRRTLAGLAATDEAGQAVLRKVPVGDVVACEIRRPRNGSQHRLYWVMCTAVAINHEQLQDAESVHQVLKMLTGLTDKIALKSTGEIVQIPRSISFSKMSADEWDAYFERAKQAVCEHLLPGVGMRELQDEIARMCA